ncbi:hypothetical protein PF004_g20930 [Phytophthora fragariae]|uniref:Uncharacterized protein n=1 Tax=Phytophthora fragariae TaxID=53985 RepID=A0A6G0N4F5_9STRA|nr:hypothetical protein PF004_g20930 [Phytophthora fragariae]
MKCSFTGCANPELTKTDPCSVCKRAVHHLCSNDLFDPGNLAVRTSCVDKWKAGILPPATSAVDDQPVTFEIVGWSPGSPAQLSSASVGLSFSQSSEETLPPDDRPCVDSYGIPLDVHHYRQLGKRDNVWDVAHVLATPYALREAADAETFTHICILCAANATNLPNAAPDAWENGLHRWGHTSNAKRKVQVFYRPPQSKNTTILLVNLLSSSLPTQLTSATSAQSKGPRLLDYTGS